jgi:dipicolinate synthase subunit A
VRKVIFCGGDKREMIVMKALQQSGYTVLAYGSPENFIPEGVELLDYVQPIFSEVAACILPQTPIKNDGQLLSLCENPVYLSKADFASLPANTPILCGVASTYLRYCAGQCRIFELAEDDRMAIPLAPANAEGAIAEAIALSGGLLSNSKALLLGFGRIGRELAWRLEGLGMDLVVLNRGRERRQEAIDLGYDVVDRSQLVEATLYADYIFNTVPALLLDALIIGLLHRETCIIDLAAYPGGTDFAAAARRGIRAIHTGGLPGKYAADYAGMIMSEFYPPFLEELLSKEVQDG